MGVNRNGAFAEYLVIPASNVWPCNPNIPEEMYAIFDPFGNATHTALSYDVLGEDVLVAGAGPIGIMAAAIVKFAGARHVVVTDFNEYRLELAKKLGATRVVNLGKEKLPDVMKEIGMTEGFDVGLEMSGSQAALHDMIHNMKHGGKIALLGLQRTDATVDLETVIFNGLNLRGIYGRKYGIPGTRCPRCCRPDWIFPILLPTTLTSKDFCERIILKQAAGFQHIVQMFSLRLSIPPTVMWKILAFHMCFGELMVLLNSMLCQ